MGPGPQLLEGPLTRLRVNDTRDIPSIRTAYSDAVPIVHASSGIRRVVCLGYMLVWAWNEHVIAAAQLGEEPTSQVVLLFDEIEAHLHPRWQRSILNSVLHVAEPLRSAMRLQLLAVTHSPLILASAEPLFDSRQDAWFDMDLVPGERRVALGEAAFHPAGHRQPLADEPGLRSRVRGPVPGGGARDRRRRGAPRSPKQGSPAEP